MERDHYTLTAAHLRKEEWRSGVEQFAHRIAALSLRGDRQHREIRTMQRGIKCFGSAILVALICSAASAVWPAPVTTGTKRTVQPSSQVAQGTTTQTILTGALIWLDSDSPYYAAGMRSRDLVVRGGGKPILNDADFYKVFAATTNTALISAEVIRGGKTIPVTVPSYLPADVMVGSHLWDWVRYLKYYAPDPRNPDRLLRKAYEDFDYRQYALAQIEFTSATKSGCKDPLTLTKLSWLLLSRRTAGATGPVEMAGKLLDQAMQAYDPSSGDKDTLAKLEGTYMIYWQALGNITQAAVHGRRGIEIAPYIVGNRNNYYQMLYEAKNFDEAAMAADALVADYPRSVLFQRLKRAANLRVGRMKGVIEASEALVNIMPEDIPTRLQLLPYLDQIADNYNLGLHCDYLLATKGNSLNDQQKAQINYYRAQINYRRRSYRTAESLVREAIRMRGNGDDYYLLGNIMHSRGKWKDAVVAYGEVRKKGWPGQTRDSYRDLRNKMDDAIDHLWSWQIKKLPTQLQNEVMARKKWLDERAVLKHSFIMRNRYGIRNVLIAIGLLMICSAIFMKLFVSE